MIHLIKIFGREKAREIFFKNKSNLFNPGGLAQSLSKRSFEYFCLYYLQDFFTPKENNTNRNLAPVHYEIWQVLENIFVKDTHDKQQFILPRGSAKTTIIDMALSVFLSCHQISPFTVVLSNRELDAVQFVEQAKLALQTPYIIHTFGKLVNSRKRTVNKLELELDNDTKIQAFSSETSVRGSLYRGARPSCYIADDYISNNDILTDKAKQKKYSRWQSDVEEGGDEAVYRDGKLIKLGTKFIVIGTPLAQGDFIDQIKHNPEYQTFHRSVVNFDVDEYFNNHEKWQQFRSIFFDNRRDNALQDAKNFYHEHEKDMKFPTLWEKFSCLKIAIGYFNKRLTFMQEMMCIAENIGDKWFTSNKVMSQDEIEELKFTKTMLTIDPAGVKNVDTKRSDNFAFVVGSTTKNNFKYIRLAQLTRFDEFDQYINHIIDILNEFDEITHVYIEKNTYNGLDVDQLKKEIANNKALSNRNITIINEMQRKNKDEKISTIVSDVNNGRIIFCESRVQESFLSEVMDFAGQHFSLSDDSVDCLAELSNRIDDIKIRNRRIKSMDRRLLGL